MMKIQKYSDDYALLLSDESKRSGFADFVCFPKNTAEVSEAMRYSFENGISVTVQGSRTGVGAGAVPEGGLVMNLEKLRKVEIVSGKDSNEKPVIIAGAGVKLSEIDTGLRRETGGLYFLPPDPTERSASAGGVASCNSSGARTYGYGPMRSYIDGLTVVLADGAVLKIRRGQYVSKDGHIEFSAKESCGECIKKYTISLPNYRMPEVKCAAGYFVKDETDLIDLFIGSEGSLGIITEVEFATEKSPQTVWGLIAFFEGEKGLKYSKNLRKRFPKLRPDLGIISIEYFDRGALGLLRSKNVGIPEAAEEAVFTEIAGESEEAAIEAVRNLEKEIRLAGGDPDLAWAAVSARSFADFKELRHKTPEAVNERVAEMKKREPLITKLGSDMSFPEEVFEEAVAMYRNDLEGAGLEHVIFGHIGNCHLHCNIIAKTVEEYSEGKKIFSRWADFAGKNGGSISAEHGVGKLKRDFLIKMYGETGVEEMKALKSAFDPKKLLGRGNIFE